MKKFRMTPAILLGITVASAPAAFAQSVGIPEATDTTRYSDRDRMTEWNREKEALERGLKPGQAIEAYRDQLQKLGYILTAVNYTTPDYVEWEVVKGNQSWEVQISLAGGKISKVDIAPNMWRADATEQALRGNRVAVAGKGDARFSDRDRRGDWVKGEEGLERALKTGQNRFFYRDELKKMGYQIAATNYDKPDYLEWEVVKGNQSYEVQIHFTGETASKVDVTTNMWRADATERALQNMGAGSRAMMPARQSESITSVRQVQKKLNEMGFHAGPVDGILGPTTRTAITNFQQAKNLQTTGRLDEQTMEALGIRN